MITVEPIPAFNDNYLWLLSGADGSAAVIDPGDAKAVNRQLAERGLCLRSILLTHHHRDHIGGVKALKVPGVTVYGPRAEANRIAGIDRYVSDGERFELPELGLSLEVIEVPGHTSGHIAYLAPGKLFCGDTLFASGCGQLFEGTPSEMHRSLQRLAQLPGTTEVYCAHEYTLANLAFASAVEEDRKELQAEVTRVRDLRAANRPSVPSTIERELRFNPFLRCGVPQVRAAVEKHTGRRLQTEVEVFAALREWKDKFKAPLYEPRSILCSLRLAITMLR